MAKILVTGGAGFIGSHVVDALVDRNTVIVLSNLSRGFKENVHSKAKLIVGDTTDHEFIFDLFEKEKFDFIYHFAAYSAVGRSHFTKRYTYQQNVIGSINLINASIKYPVKCFVFSSSISVYGSAQLPFKESMPPNPDIPYGISKYTIELELKSCFEKFGLNYIIFRPFNVYGERQNIGDSYRNVAGIFIRQLITDQPVTLVNNGIQKLAFTHVSDISDLIARSPFVKEAYNDVYNIGGQNLYSVMELAECISQAMGVKLKVKNIPGETGMSEYSDINKAKTVFSWEPKIELEDGINRMVIWALKTGVRRIEEYGDVEVEQP